MPSVAGIDIGSNTVRLLIALVDDRGRLTPVEAVQRIVRLGEGMGASPELQPAAMDRAVEVLRQFQSRIVHHQPQIVTVTATSAVREARNRDVFLDRVKTETGLSVEVITGEEEARRTLLGVWGGIAESGRAQVDHLLLIDIGGGSTEYVQGRRHLVDGWVSTSLGVVRLTEQLIHHDPPSSGEIQRARDHFHRELSAVAAQFGPLPTGCRLVGTAGTVTTIAVLTCGLERYDPAVVHGMVLPLSAVNEWTERLIHQTVAQRRALPVMESGRADLIVAGSLLLQASMQQWRMNEIVVSDWGLREGIVLEAADRARG